MGANLSLGEIVTARMIEYVDPNSLRIHGPGHGLRGGQGSVIVEVENARDAVDMIRSIFAKAINDGFDVGKQSR